MRAEGKEEHIIQNLRDAGCDPETIRYFITNFRTGEEASAVKRLAAHRRKLLEAVHDNQKRIDCLDYLLWQMQKERNDDHEAL